MVFSTQLLAYGNLGEYLQDIDQRSQPRVLIVGCGHVPDEKASTYEYASQHKHEGAWTVDVADSEIYKPQGQSSSKSEGPYWGSIKSDAELDITTPYFPSSYKGLFDVVVLERIWSKPLNNKWTLFNAASMLKQGGELVVDVHSSYSYHAYATSKTQGGRWQINSPLYDEVDELSAKLCLSPAIIVSELDAAATELLKRKFERFGLTLPTRAGATLPLSRDDKFREMGFYLTMWGFTGVIPFQEAYQPWTREVGKELASSRRGDLLVATKGPHMTQDLMMQWHKAIRSLK